MVLFIPITKNWRKYVLVKRLCILCSLYGKHYDVEGIEYHNEINVMSCVCGYRAVALPYSLYNQTTIISKVCSQVRKYRHNAGEYIQRFRTVDAYLFRCRREIIAPLCILSILI